MAERDPRARTFGPVAATGLGAAALAAVAGSQPWLGTSAGDSADASMTAVDQGTRYPAASAVSLLLLAAWGVLLVTRGRLRRAFAVVAALVSLAAVAAVVAGYATLPDQATSSFDQLMGRGGQESGFTGWFWTAAVAAALSVPPALAAVALAPGWPEMGSRYDAPAAGDTPPTPAAVETDRDLWTELDQGRDPTAADPSRRGTPGAEGSV